MVTSSGRNISKPGNTKMLYIGTGRFKIQNLLQNVLRIKRN